MVSRRNRTLLSLAIFVGVLAWNVTAAAVKGETDVPVGSLSVHEIEEQLQDCPLVQALNQHKVTSNPTTSSLTSQIFAFLFPGSPAVNALLATLYISGPPNFLLALCPPNIDPSSLSVMVAFAVGGLLGDTLFHLLPEIFLGEDEPDKVKFVMVEPNKNLLLGVAIMVGFVTFVAMDKGLRIATGGEGGHDHSHGHSHEKVEASAKATGADANGSKDSLRARKPAADGTTAPATVESEKEINASVKLGGYLNLIADFTHNITDGLALSSSFYASPTIGATTTVAVFFHEIPHEVGDFALLIQSGFSKRAAMGAQFVTAVGAFIGTCIGIAVQEFGGNSASAKVNGPGLMGTSLQWGDMLLPFTAGTFLYVGTVAVIPELLETGPNKGQELRKTLTQFAAMFTGAGIMLAISWS
ncbi:ZIP zinc transporter-like protein [Setomelanomma holmii]|uniref:ZIP zinc transporter-like protein n=1 Tax=Setomelanomma holmii TaxID=210430 RepID=A0A9P4H3P2_9PLEO|nr:ZIP zinc transporter-like protein [Setomelanomma holmii]